MATDPQPVPTSHNSAPRIGISLATVTARTSCFVMVPSDWNSASGRPGTRGNRAASGEAIHSTASVLNGGTTCAQSAAVPSNRASSGPPIAASTVIRLPPKPRIARKPAICAGVSAPVVRISNRASG